MTTYFHRYYGFDKLTSYLYLHQGQYDAVNGKVYDESMLNGDARAVQPGRGYKFDGVDSEIHIVFSNVGTLYVSAIKADGTLDTDISINYDTDRYKIQKTVNEVVWNIKVWAISGVSNERKKSVTLENDLIAWYKGDEGALDDAFDSKGNNESRAKAPGKIVNADLSEFHYEGGDIGYSWQNFFGYSYDNTNDRFIPRDENSPNQDVQGNALQYSEKVPFDVVAKGSSCAHFDGQDFYADTGEWFNFIHQTAVFYIKILIRIDPSVSQGQSFPDDRRHIIDSHGDQSNPGFHIKYVDEDSTIRINLEIGDGVSSGIYVNVQTTREQIQKWNVIEAEGDGSTILLSLNGQSNTNQFSPQGSNDAVRTMKIASRNNAPQSNTKCEIAQLIISNPDNPADDAEYTFAESGLSGTLFDRRNNRNASISADIQTFWSKLQDVFHANLKHGFDLWQHDASGEYMRVPLRDDGSSIKGENDTISGYTWVSKHLTSKKFHNRAETVFDTVAENPLHYKLKQVTGMEGIHPDNVYPSDQFFKKQLNKAEANRFTGYFTEQTGKRLTKTQNFVQ